MIKGIGVDITEITRIAQLLEDTRFLERCFSGGERAMLAERKEGTSGAAANFAAKEAFSKALGTGVRGFNLCDIEVLRDEAGKPYITLYNQAKAIADGMGITRIHVSLSHSNDNAIAFVMAE